MDSKSDAHELASLPLARRGSAVRWLVAGMAIACGCALPSFAQAYRTFSDLPEFADAAGAPIAWRSFPIAIEVCDDAMAPLDGAATRAALELAIERWNRTMCTADAFGPVSISDFAASDDGYNTVQWIRSSWRTRADADAVATTASKYEVVNGEYALVQADIYLNADTVTWSADMLADLDGVLAHELGHVLGLAHPCEPAGEGGAPVCTEDDAPALMHPLYDPENVELTGDDEAGTCFLYPEGPTFGRDSAAETDGSSEGGVGCSIAGPRSIRGSGAVTVPVFAALALLSLRCSARSSGAATDTSRRRNSAFAFERLCCRATGWTPSPTSSREPGRAVPSCPAEGCNRCPSSRTK